MEIRGVYSILHAESGRRYVGSSVNVRRRWTQHLRPLRKGRHPNVYLQAAWSRYGESAFSFEILEEVSAPAPLAEREKVWVEKFAALDRGRGFNLREPGKEMPDEARAAISAANRRKLSKEHCEAISQGRRGMKFTDEHRAAIKRVKTGAKYGPVSAEKSKRLTEGQLRRAQREGPVSAERRARLVVHDRSEGSCLMKKPHAPIHNLGNFAHPPKAEQSYAKPPKAQTQSNTSKLVTKSAKGKRV